LTIIRYQGENYERNEGETVLDVLHRNRIPAPFSCRRGVCHTCMMQVVSGEIPARAQEGLLDKFKSENFFLACLCWPKHDIEVCYADEKEICIPAKVVSREDLTTDICRLYLQPSRIIDYRPGQFINWHQSPQLIRSYSLASLPAHDRWLELHVKRKVNGLLSNFILDEIREGDVIDIQGPHGDSYYRDCDPATPLLMVGTGTGLSPLIGIVRDALYQGHTGDIMIYHGARTSAGIYDVERLAALAAEHNNVSYQACVSGEGETPYLQGRASAIALANHTDLRGWKVYLCGDPAMVRQTRHKACLAGARFHDVIMDPFEYTELRKS
jgi:NAD(P)H-flavin reductase